MVVCTLLGLPQSCGAGAVPSSSGRSLNIQFVQWSYWLTLVPRNWKLVAQESCPTLWDHGWKSPGKKTGVGCHSLLQGIFLTQGSNPGLLNSKQILGHQGSPYPDTQVSRLNQSVYMGKQDMETPGRAPKKRSGHSDRRSFWSGLLWGGISEGWPEPKDKRVFHCLLLFFLQKDTHRIKNPI